MKDVKSVIEKKYDELSKSHKKIADYIMANISDAAFMTAREIGIKAGASEATTVRFAYNLGYKSFGDFMSDLGVWAKKDLSLQSDLGSIHCNNIPDALKNTIKKDLENLSQTLADINPDAFTVAVDIIMNSKKVYILGQGSSRPLAELMAYNLHLFRDDVVVVSSISSEEIFEQLLFADGKDAVIGICFPPYSVRTIKALELCNEKKTDIITITDDKYSPVNIYSSCNLLAPCSLTDNTYSFTAALSVINSLLVALELKYKKNLNKNKKQLEDIWNNYLG